MGQTTAQALIQEGQEIGALQNEQRVLINLLNEKFGHLQPNIVQQIQSIREQDTLDTYLRKLLTAKTLEEIGIV